MTVSMHAHMNMCMCECLVSTCMCCVMCMCEHVRARVSMCVCMFVCVQSKCRISWVKVFSLFSFLQKSSPKCFLTSPVVLGPLEEVSEARPLSLGSDAQPSARPHGAVSAGPSPQQGDREIDTLVPLSGGPLMWQPPGLDCFFKCY